MWWLQSALVGHDVSKGVGADMCRLLGIGLHEVEDPEARRLDLPPHVRCVRLRFSCTHRHLHAYLSIYHHSFIDPHTHPRPRLPTSISRARLAARASQLQAACADLHASPGFRLEDDGATAMYVCRVEPGGKMVFASNAAHDAMFRKAREVMEDCEARRMPPAWVFSAVVCPEDRQEWFKATIQMMFGRRGHGHHVATNAPHARVKPLTVSRFIKVGGRMGGCSLVGIRYAGKASGRGPHVLTQPPPTRHVGDRPERAHQPLHLPRQPRAPPGGRVPGHGQSKCVRAKLRTEGIALTAMM